MKSWRVEAFRSVIGAAGLVVLAGCAEHGRHAAITPAAVTTAQAGTSDLVPSHRQYYDQRRKRYYYFDPGRRAYFWEDGTPKT